MILVLFFCTIIVLITLAVIFIILSTVRIEVRDFELASVKHIEPNYEVVISFSLLNKLKWISFRLNNKRMKKMYTKMHLERIDIKKLERNIKPSDIREIIKIRPKLTRLDLQMSLGIENVIITSHIIPIICTILSIMLPHVTEKKNIKNIKYKIEPVYNKNIYHIKLDTTLEIKVINVLNSVYRIYKSKRNSTSKKRKRSIEVLKYHQASLKSYL